MADTTEPAAVLLSGGIDSTVLLHYVVRRLRRHPVHALSFDYGQRHRRELACAQFQARAAGAAEHHVIDTAFLGALLSGGSALLAGGADVPSLEEIPEKARNQPSTYVPNRNMMLLAMAAAYAEAHHIRTVFYGAQAQDEYGYWDCTADFLERLNAVFALNRGTPVCIEAPFVNRTKAENVRLGGELAVDFAHTWSCYRGEETACGVCPTCVERRNAFSAAGAQDPIHYA